MALMGFLLIAGLGTAGQLVSAFTLGTVLATIPLIALTRQTATSEASGENADVANSKLGVSLGKIARRHQPFRPVPPHPL
jgi:hypothetical protein